MTLFTYFKVTCNFDYEREFDPELRNADTFSFASLAGARAWVEKNREHLLWYSIEGLEALPCREEDPDGQVYYGVIHSEFHDERRMNEDGDL